MRAAVAAAVAAVAVAFSAGSCGRTKPAVVAPVEGGVAPGLTACLDRPDELPRPPTSGLPCDLIPPGLTLE